MLTGKDLEDMGYFEAFQTKESIKLEDYAEWVEKKIVTSGDTRFLENTLGLGETHAKQNDQGPFVVQASFHYLNEMKYNDRFFVQATLIDFDTKKMHLCLEIISEEKKMIMAISEQLMLNVNLIKRKTETYPNWAIKRLTLMKENHKKIKLPQNIGRKILIKK